MTMRNSICFSLLFIILLGCDDQSITSQQATQQIDYLYRQFAEAYDSLDTDKVANLYADSAFYLIPNQQAPILKGRASIRNSFAGFIEASAQNNRAIDISFRILERKISDSLAFDVGYYRTRSKPDTAADFPEEGSVGKFVTVMGLMEEGSWKFLLDGYNPAPPDLFLDDTTAHNPLATTN